MHMLQHGDETGPAPTQRTDLYKDLVLLQLAALVLATDQFTKFLVREFLEFGQSFPDEGFFRLTHTYNTGSAFGLFQDQNVPLALVSIIGITILALIYRSQRRPSNLLRLSLGLQFGGAAGNLLDRVRMGHVTDFVDVGAWPIFNVADASIVVGLALLAWFFWSRGGPRLKDTGAGGADTREGIPNGLSEAPIGIPSASGTSLRPTKEEDSAQSTAIPDSVSEGETLRILPGDSEDGEDPQRAGNAPVGE